MGREKKNSPNKSLRVDRQNEKKRTEEVEPPRLRRPFPHTSGETRRHLVRINNTGDDPPIEPAYTPRSPLEKGTLVDPVRKHRGPWAGTGTLVVVGLRTMKGTLRNRVTKPKTGETFDKSTRETRDVRLCSIAAARNDTRPKEGPSTLETGSLSLQRTDEIDRSRRYRFTVSDPGVVVFTYLLECRDLRPSGSGSATVPAKEDSGERNRTSTAEEGTGTYQQGDDHRHRGSAEEYSCDPYDVTPGWVHLSEIGSVERVPEQKFVGVRLQYPQARNYVLKSPTVSCITTGKKTPHRYLDKESVAKGRRENQGRKILKIPILRPGGSDRTIKEESKRDERHREGVD